jgi:hypothetical protein
MFVLYSVVSLVVSILLWFMFPGFIIYILDFNLWAIKWTLGVLPFIGKHVEAGLRMMGLDKVLYFMEVGIAIRIFVAVIFRK